MIAFVIAGIGVGYFMLVTTRNICFLLCEVRDLRAEVHSLTESSKNDAFESTMYKYKNV